MNQHERISVKFQDDWQAAAMKLLRLLTDRKHGCLCVRCLEQIYNEQVAQLTTDNGGK